jgi:hypothetical protein
MESASKVDEYVASIAQESDRGAVIVAAAYLDEALERVIRARLRASRSKRDPLFKGSNPPLRSFAIKIEMAHRMGIIVAGLAKALDLFRELRNDCAHKPNSFRFADNETLETLRKLFHQNPGLYRFVSGRGLEEFDAESMTGTPGAAVRVRGEFNLYYGYLALKLFQLTEEGEAPPSGS